MRLSTKMRTAFEAAQLEDTPLARKVKARLRKRAGTFDKQRWWDATPKRSD